ncbi:hypothetical protein D9M68_949740 [compost metagenome]
MRRPDGSKIGTATTVMPLIKLSRSMLQPRALVSSISFFHWAKLGALSHSMAPNFLRSRVQFSPLYAAIRRPVALTRDENWLPTSVCTRNGWSDFDRANTTTVCLGVTSTPIAVTP